VPLRIAKQVGVAGRSSSSGGSVATGLGNGRVEALITAVVRAASVLPLLDILAASVSRAWS
jgi:hypothetical protein